MVLSASANTFPRRLRLPAVADKIPLRAGTIFETGESGFSFYAWIPWPFGGDPCSDRFGLRLVRWQLLAVVDARWEFCPAFDIVARDVGPSQGRGTVALIGRIMHEIAQPALWRLGRKAWSSKIVRGALKFGSQPARRMSHVGKKCAFRKFFERFWIPAELIPGHISRDGIHAQNVTALARACQAGHADPREHFISLESIVPRVIGCVQFANTEPVESSSGWGCWIPWERFGQQMKERPPGKLDPSQRSLFTREQRLWMVDHHRVGGMATGAGIRFPVYFQYEPLREFAGRKIQVCFDSWAERITATFVLPDAWRGYRRGHIIARDVPALESSVETARTVLACALRSARWLGKL